MGNGGTGANPYQAATNQNTSTTWLSDEKPVDVNLHGMADFAKNLNTISDNLTSHQQRVMSQMTSIIEGNAFAGGFPEVSYAAKLHSQNLAEFAQYLNRLWQAIQHTGSAAQVIADSYASTDGWSAASLDAVNFAFGVPGAKRPSGLPSVFGQTYSDKQAEQDAQAAAATAGANGHPDSQWRVQSTSADGAGGTTTTYVDQYGETRQVSVAIVNGQTVTTMIGVDGKKTVTTESTYSYPYGSVTTRTTTTPDGKTSTSTVTTYSSGNTMTTENADGSGKVTSSTSETYGTDGGHTDTTYSYDNSGKKTTTGQISYGNESPGVGTTVDSPAADAEQQLKNTISPPDNNTKVLAPGAPGSSPSGSTATA